MGKDQRTSLQGFIAGIWSRKLDGQTKLDLYVRACRELENFVVWPHGTIQNRSGGQYIARTKAPPGSSTQSRLEPAVISSSLAFILEFGPNFVRFFDREGNAILSGGSPYEIVTPYTEAQLFDLKIIGRNKRFYITHGSHHPDFIEYHAPDEWHFHDDPIDPLPSSVTMGSAYGHTAGGGYPDPYEITIAAVDASTTIEAGDFVELTSDADTFIGLFIESSAGRIVSYKGNRIFIMGSLRYPNSDLETAAIGRAIDSGELVPIATKEDWEMSHTPLMDITPSGVGIVGGYITLNATTQQSYYLRLQDSAWPISSTPWALSNLGGGRYYVDDAGPPFDYFDGVKPDKILWNFQEMTYVPGTPTAPDLQPGTWMFGKAAGESGLGGVSTVYLSPPLGDVQPLTDTATFDSTIMVLAQKKHDVVGQSTFRPEDVGKYIYIHGGVLQIASVTTPLLNQCVCRVIQVLEAATATYDWTLEGALWNDTDGWPICATFYQDRLVFARGHDFWGSKPGKDNYFNFTLGPNDGDAYAHTLGSGNNDGILWLAADKFLLAGMGGKVWRIGSGEIITPSSVSSDVEVHDGSEQMQPVEAGSSLFMIESIGRALLELSYKERDGGYIAPNRSILADDLLVSGIKSFAYAPTPLPSIWCVTNDGDLIVMTLYRDDKVEVLAWSLMTTDGRYEDVAVIPGTDRSQIWTIVNRTIDGRTLRSIERFHALFDMVSDVIIDGHFLDSEKTETPANAGTKVYVSSDTDGKIYQYDLSTGWDASTGSYASKNKVIPDSPVGIFISLDGVNMYVLRQLVGASLINYYTLSTPWDLSTAVYVSELDLNERDFFGLYFKDDGSAMYLLYSLGFTFEVWQYDLSTPWDITTAVYSKKVSIVGSAPWGLYFSPKGRMMFVTDESDSILRRYDLGVDWDVTTAVYNNSMDLDIDDLLSETGTTGLSISTDGKTLFVVGSSGDKVYQVDLPTAWNTSTGTASGKTIDISSETSWPSGIFVRPGDMVNIADGAHLEGKTVTVFVNGVYVGERDIVSGAFTVALDAKVSSITYGLPYESVMRTMRGAFEGTLGESQGESKVFGHITGRFLATKGGQIGVHENGADILVGIPDSDTLFSGDRKIAAPGGNDTDGIIVVKQSDPFPIAVNMVIPEVEVNDDEG